MRIWYHIHQLPKTFTHFHTEFEIMYCVCGSYVFHYIDSSGKQIDIGRIQPKTMLFIPKGLQHGVHQVEYPYRRFFLNLPVPQVIELLNSPLLLSPFQTYHYNDAGKKELIPRTLDATKSASVIEPILNQMLNIHVLSDMNSNHTELHMKSLLGLLFCELSRNHQDFFSAPHTPLNHMVTEAHAYIDQHYDQHLSIHDLAKRYYVHPNYFTHCFTKQIGISPRKYLTNIRLANARKLLETENDTVQSIALRVGYTDINNFIQTFRIHYGMTPKRYRKKVTAEFFG